MKKGRRSFTDRSSAQRRTYSSISFSLHHLDMAGTAPSPSSIPSAQVVGSGLSGPFSSLEERIAHLQWRKACTDRQIQGTLRRTKQMQERDDHLRVAKQGSGGKEKREWVHTVVQDELNKPLPITPQFLDQLSLHESQLEIAREQALTRHLTQIKNIQERLDDREAQLVRKKEFEKKKKELFA